MAYGLEVYGEAGQLLLQTENILYGLIKSDYLQLVDWWAWYRIRSANLDPTDESSYSPEPTACSPIAAITVTNATSPVVFVAGDNVPLGTSASGTSITFYFGGVFPNTKAYVFDRMQDKNTGVGMQAFNAQGVLTFTTEMPSLNIVDVVQAPPPPAPSYVVNGVSYYATCYSGGNNTVVPYFWNQSIESQNRTWNKSQIIVPTVATGEIATYMSFTRNCGIWTTDALESTVGGNEGCGGGNIGGVKFFFIPASFTIQQWSTVRMGNWFDIPVDRYPQVSVIQTSDYPFPFQV